MRRLINPRCFLICVGSELLRGKLNTHAATFSKRLPEAGLTLGGEQTVADDLKTLTRTISDRLKENDIVIITGGLGPTFDDVTREATSKATGRLLRSNPKLVTFLRNRFRTAKLQMPSTNLRQADLLEGARVVPNPVGTAPGQWLELRAPTRRQKTEDSKNKKTFQSSVFGSRLLVLLPGPPRELYPMLDTWVLPQLKKCCVQPKRLVQKFHLYGFPESHVDEVVREIIHRFITQYPKLHFDFTILAHLSLVDFEIYVTGSNPRQMSECLKLFQKEIQDRYGDAIYGHGNCGPLESIVASRFIQRHQTLSVAESCTGGMLASRLTDVSGSSRFFLGGVISYANVVKEKQLGVPRSMLQQKGAVSEEVACAMARGVRHSFRSSVGVGITGIAGPTGATSQKPVGRVYIAVSTAKGESVKQYDFRGDRTAIRERAVLAALDQLRKILVF